MAVSQKLSIPTFKLFYSVIKSTLHLELNQYNTQLNITYQYHEKSNIIITENLHSML